MSWGTEVCTKVVFSEILIGHYVSRSHERILRDLLLHWHPLLYRTSTAVWMWESGRKGLGVLKHAFYICRLLHRYFPTGMGRLWYSDLNKLNIWHHVFQCDFFFFFVRAAVAKVFIAKMHQMGHRPFFHLELVTELLQIQLPPAYFYGKCCLFSPSSLPFCDERIFSCQQLYRD